MWHDGFSTNHSCLEFQHQVFYEYHQIEQTIDFETRAKIFEANDC